MTDTTFTPSTPPVDPSKHVNYLLGMVLGVEDFDQEFAYLSNRDQWLARDLLGYGTVCGLKVLDAVENNHRVLRVQPGVALSPSGKLIKVKDTQCADLTKWIEDEAVKARLTSPSTTVYLTLCYRGCPTDTIAIAGKPCSAEINGLLNPSRIQDDCYLDLFFDSEKLPDQTEEDYLRLFVTTICELLAARPTQTAKKASSKHWTPDSFTDAIRDAVKIQIANKEPVMGFVKQVKRLPIANDQLNGILRAVFHYWIAELRPVLRGRNADCVIPSQEDCILLAKLEANLEKNPDGKWLIKGITIDETKRPYLLHLRMVQEWILQNSCFPGNTVIAENTFSNVQQPSNPGNSNLFSRADHTHGIPKDPIIDHVADTDAHNNHLVSGEVTGTIGNTVVSEILDLPVAYPPPASSQVHAGQVLTLVPAPPEKMEGKLPAGKHALKSKKASVKTMETNLKWQATDLPTPSITLTGDVVKPVDNGLPTDTRIERLQGKLVNASAPGNYNVLTFMPGGSGITAVIEPRWRPMNLLDGDVIRSPKSGPAEIKNWIQSLQDKPVDAADPSYKQVLTFVKGDPEKDIPDHWRPMDLSITVPSVTLGGDVQGSANNNEIKFLQDNPVFASTPDYGQVLTFVQTYIDPDTGGEISDCWVPQASTATGQFVKRSRSEPYEIVAAGAYHFTADAPYSIVVIEIMNSYNNLTAKSAQFKLNDKQTAFDGELVFHFPNPDSASKYIVKLTPWCESQMDITVGNSSLFTVYFAGFIYNTDQKLEDFRVGISSLREIDANKPLDVKIMVEVSQFTPDDQG